MQSFTKISGIAAPLAIDNVDTDMIIPKQFLKTIKRTGLKEGLFYEMRYDVDGNRIADFVLHNAPYDKAEILVSGANFGCGSSREHAPWALLDFGIRSVIAESFADIFYNNCFKNGILPVKLPKAQVERIMEVAKSANPEVRVDLENQQITAGNEIFKFEVDAFRKNCLLKGLDDIGLTLEKKPSIDSFEEKQALQQPWRYKKAS